MQRYVYLVKIKFEDQLRKIEGTRAVQDPETEELVIYDGEEVVARLRNVESWSRETA